MMHGGSRTLPSSLDTLKEKVFNPTRVSLARLVMELERFENYPWGESRLRCTQLFELGATFGNPLPNNPSPDLGLQGCKGPERFKEAILGQDGARGGRDHSKRGSIIRPFGQTGRASGRSYGWNHDPDSRTGVQGSSSRPTRQAKTDGHAKTDGRANSL
ncbi:hypothetical protein Bca52824_075171 [Brassica carinata]|uniref:DUF1985 domain-containing protein n=1 Tax=Brassica carinata TaxID=52824 RepID=A0A8X7PRN4_BRACI|nr:hypothetical protein Bca52824_075171 [Brassica carinata]